MCAENMSGHMMTHRSQLEIVYSRAEQQERFLSLGRTRLAGPLEFIHFFFQVEGVPRWFTHQLVRTRIASYSQSSMRFVNHASEGLPVLRPNLTSEQEEVWDSAIQHVESAYTQLVCDGVSFEDARGLLPNAILTNIGIDMSLKTLIGVAETRLCFQAQTLWQEFMSKVKVAIISFYAYSPAGEAYLINDLLVPACQRAGKCTFKSMYDRKCPKDPALKGECQS